MSNRSARAVLALICACGALGVASPAFGQTPVPSGVEKAKAEGIVIDPGAEAAMAAAPAGSCYGDPTQSKCPRATRVAASVASETSDGRTAYAALPGRSSAVAAAVPQCFVKSDPPFFAAGLAQGHGAHTCTNAVSRQELYVTLYDNISSGWRQLDTRSASKNGGGSLNGDPKYNCDHAVTTRQYQVLAEGYALLQGVWYAASQRDYASFKCPY